MTVNVCCPCPKRDQSSRINRSTENILEKKIPFVPKEHLSLVTVVFLVPTREKPISISVVSVLEPLRNKVGSVMVIKSHFYKFCHSESRWPSGRIEWLFLGHL